MKLNIRLYAVVFFIGLGAWLNGFVYERQFLYMDALLFLLLAGLWIYEKNVRLYSFQIPLFMMIACYWISVAYAMDKEQAVLEAARWTGLVPLSFMAVLPTEGSRESVRRVLIWAGAGLTLFGIMSSLFREGRLESTFQYANALALLLLLALLAVLDRLANRAGLLDAVLAGMILTGLLLTYSRFVWVLAVPALAAMMFLHKGLRSMRFLVIVSALAVCAVGWLAASYGLSGVGERIRSIGWHAEELQLRLVYWKDGWDMLRTYGWFGTGGGGWSLAGPQGYYVKYVHNQYLQTALDAGIPALVAFAAVFVLYFRKVSARKETFYSNRTSFIGICCFMLHGAFDITFLFPVMMGLWLMWVGEAWSEGEALALWKLRNGAGAALAVILSAVAFGFSWIGTGYVYKEQGIRLAAKGSWEEAQMKFQDGIGMIPWSHTIRYESANAFIRQGNQTMDRKYYESALESMKKACQMVPISRNYCKE